jgi:hypothetical protein
MNEKYRQKLIDLVQPEVAEPIVALGVFQPEGSWRASASHLVGSDAVGSGIQNDANQRAGGLARNGVFTMKMALVAATEHEIHVFSVKPRSMSGFKLVGEVAAWRREDVRFRITSPGMSTSIYLEVVPTNEAYELEATMVGTLKPINQELFDAIAEPAAA